jgi:hypothetical protein
MFQPAGLGFATDFPGCVPATLGLLLLAELMLSSLFQYK